MMTNTIITLAVIKERIKDLRAEASRDRLIKLSTGKKKHK
jgi:hypothetical protein